MNNSRKIKISFFCLILMNPFLDISYAVNSGGTVALGAFKLLISMVLFALVILITVHGTRYIAKNFTQANQSKHIKVIDRVSLTSNFNIYILYIAGKYYLVGNTENHIKVIDILDEEELSLEDIYTDDLDESKVNVNILDQFKELLSKEDKYEE